MGKFQKGQPRHKNAGRKKGTTNRRTLQRNLILARAQKEASERRMLATEVLDKYMHEFMEEADRLRASGSVKERARWPLMALAARDTAGLLARYQSPTFKSVEMDIRGNVVKEFTLEIFDSRPLPKLIDGRMVNGSGAETGSVEVPAA